MLLGFCFCDPGYLPPGEVVFLRRVCFGHSAVQVVEYLRVPVLAVALCSPASCICGVRRSAFHVGVAFWIRFFDVFQVVD